MLRTPAMALIAALALPVSANAAAKMLQPGDHERPIPWDRLERSYILHLPPAAAAGKPLPLVLAFHGGGGNASGFQKYAGLDTVADREGFVVAYPNGTGRFEKRLLTWNTGRCCAWAQEHDVDDVGFALAVIDSVAKLTPIDGKRIYATGHSNGAMMSYRLAAEAADRIAAIAPVAGAMNVEKPFAPSRAVPVLHIHSVDDPRALWAGGDNKSMSGATIHHEPVVAALELWETRNGCTGKAEEVERRTAPSPNGEGEHTAIHLAVTTCTSGAPIELWKLSGPGHGWPGESEPPLPERVVGPRTNVINAAEEAWKFFARFALDD